MIKLILFTIISTTLVCTSQGTTCPGPEPSSGLTARCTNGYNYRSRCVLNCPPGHRLVSNRRRRHTCLLSGRWRPSFDTVQCVPVSPPTTSGSCKKVVRPNMISFCRYSSSRGFYCNIRCRSGYSLSGARSAVCRNGQFSPSLENNKCVKTTSINRPCSVCGKK